MFRAHRPALTSQHGFTLMEILVALAVVSFALASLINASGSAVYRSTNLKDRTFAQWVAENRATEIRLNKTLLVNGTRTGNSRMNRREWIWKTIVTNTPDPYVRKIVVTVSPASDPKQILATLISYVSRKH